MTNEQMARAFNEWMRRFVEAPDQFEREFESVGLYLREQSAGREPSYGDQSAAYLQRLAAEIAS